MGKVTYIEADGASHTVEVATGENVMRGALDHDLPGIVGECGGGLACATCHCYVDDAWTGITGGPSSQDEIDMLESTAAEMKPASRLSCDDRGARRPRRPPPRTPVLGAKDIHQAIRTVGKCHRAIDMILERAVSRRTRGRRLGDHQMVQAKIADSLIELEQFRLLVLKTAWLIDEIEGGRLPHGAARNHIGMCKVAMAAVWMNVIGRALEVHGSLGISLDLPLANWFGGGMGLAFADGPTDVHKSQLARAYLAATAPVEGMFPTEHIPTRTVAALARYPAARG